MTDGDEPQLFRHRTTNEAKNRNRFTGFELIEKLVYDTDHNRKLGMDELPRVAPFQYLADEQVLLAVERRQERLHSDLSCESSPGLAATEEFVALLGHELDR